MNKFKIVFLCFSIFFLSCENDFKEVQQEITEDQVAIEVGEEVELIYSDSGRIEIKIKAPLLHRHLDKREPRREFPKGLEIFFFDKDQQVKGWLTGKYAIEYEEKHQTIFRDSVVFFNQEQQKLETDELIWDESNEKIYTKQFVRLTTHDKLITGYGFEADKEFKQWKVIAPQGSLKVDPNKLEN